MFGIKKNKCKYCKGKGYNIVHKPLNPVAIANFLISPLLLNLVEEECKECKGTGKTKDIEEK